MLDATTIVPPTTNGLHYEPTTDPDSPLADSPDTPINTVSDVAVKIDSDIPEVESDARHEPYQISLDLDKLDDASIRPQIDAPIVPSSSFFLSPFHPSYHRFLLSSKTRSPPLTVRLLHLPLISLETSLWQKKILSLRIRFSNTRMLRWGMQNHSSRLSMPPSEADEPPTTQSPSGTPGSAVGGSSITAVDSVHVRDVSPNEDDAPPAKRARKFSDADQASAHQTVAHVSSLCLVRHHWRANIVVFFCVRSCKDFPSTWSRTRRTYKWRVASVDTQCIAAQVCFIYDTNPQKDEGCHSLPLPRRPRGPEDTSLSSDCQASYGLFNCRAQITSL